MGARGIAALVLTLGAIVTIALVVAFEDAGRDAGTDASGSAAAAAPRSSGASDAPIDPADHETAVPSAVRETADGGASVAAGDTAETGARSMLHVAGTIVDAYGGALLHAHAELRDRNDELIATAPCNGAGAFDLRVERDKPLYLWGVAADHDSVRREPWIYLSQDDVWCDFELEPVSVTIRGRLFDSHGAPLTRDLLLAVFPSLSPETSWKRDPGESGVSACLDGLVGQRDCAFAADVDLDRASFTIDVPSGFEGEVVAQSRDRVVAARPWRSGDGVVDLTIDVDAARARGVIELHLFDAATHRPVEEALVMIDRASCGVLPVDARHERAMTSESEPGTYRFEDVEIERWHLFVRADRFAPISRIIEVRPGPAVPIEIALDAGATVRVIPRVVDNAGIEFSGTCIDYVDANGNAFGGETSAMLPDGSCRLAHLPVGRGVLLLNGNALEVDLVPGENPDVEWALQPVVDFGVVVRLGDLGAGRHARHVDSSLSVCTAGGVSIDSFGSHADADAERRIRMGAFATPGAHRLAFEWARGKRVERDVVIAPDGTTTIELDLTTGH